MMLFGFPTKIDNMLSTIVVAAGSKNELDGFYTELAALKHSPIITGLRRATFIDLLSDPMFNGYRALPIIIVHKDEFERTTFFKEFKIEQITPENAIAIQLEMLNPKTGNAVTEEEEVVKEDTRTLAEIYGLTEEDPWDNKSDEEKEEDRIARETYEKAQKEGKLTGPFRGGEGDKIVIQDIRGKDKTEITATAIKFPERKLTEEQIEQKRLIEIAGTLTSKESRALAQAVLCGTFTKEDYAKKLDEYGKKKEAEAAKAESKVEEAPACAEPECCSHPAKPEEEKTENGIPTNPKDYYFAVFSVEEDDFIYAVITPIKYFEEHNALYDGNLSGIIKGLGNWGEETESTFSSPFNSLKESYDDLLAKGMVDSTEFKRFMADTGIDVYNLMHKK
jgi:hypothetical protein